MNKLINNEGKEIDPVEAILGHTYPGPIEGKCVRTGKHTYHKGIGKGRHCVYCGHIKSK